jgi:acid phosphatase family membrane protein YuiD
MQVMYDAFGVQLHAKKQVEILTRIENKTKVLTNRNIDP